MRAMILAAGRGERLRPMTDELPKPLIEAGGKPLIGWHLEALARAGFREVIINLGHLGSRLRDALGDGGRWGLNIHYSLEPPDALETGGGIFQALPLLGQGPFLVINGDIWTDYPLAGLRAIKCDHAHLVLVPQAVPGQGDFALDGGRIRNAGERLHIFSGIAVYHPRLFAGCQAGRFSVVPLLRQAVDTRLVTGELFRGLWFDAGTPDRLARLRERLAQSRAGNGA
jgi:MurNAc alpha-1-phosphate uridylyltransferase